MTAHYSSEPNLHHKLHFFLTRSQTTLQEETRGGYGPKSSSAQKHDTIHPLTPPWQHKLNRRQTKPAAVSCQCRPGTLPGPAPSHRCRRRSPTGNSWGWSWHRAAPRRPSAAPEGRRLRITAAFYTLPPTPCPSPQRGAARPRAPGAGRAAFPRPARPGPAGCGAWDGDVEQRGDAWEGRCRSSAVLRRTGTESLLCAGKATQVCCCLPQREESVQLCEAAPKCRREQSKSFPDLDSFRPVQVWSCGLHQLGSPSRAGAVLHLCAAVQACPAALPPCFSKVAGLFRAVSGKPVVCKIASGSIRPGVLRGARLAVCSPPVCIKAQIQRSAEDETPRPTASVRKQLSQIHTHPHKISTYTAGIQHGSPAHCLPTLT